MFAVMLAAVALAVTPAPSPTPLKQIEHVYSTPFCTAFTQNIRRSVEGVLRNDTLFKNTEPVFLQAAHDMVSGGFMTSSFNARGPARMNPDNPRVHLAMNRLREFSGSIAHNLQVIDRLLNDVQRFPKADSAQEMRELLALREQLLKLAKAQNDTLNVLSGTTEEFMFDSLFNSDVSAGGVLSANGKAPASAGTLQGGPIKSKGDAGNPELTQNDLFMSSAMGELYQELLKSESQEQTLEQQFTPKLVQAAQHCAP